ncbi:MAG: tetratricopeptide repeat protein [bacterium]|nr:tetratricopeptide repeat protein [bacterium]
MKLSLKFLGNLFTKKEENKLEKVIFYTFCGIVFLIPLFFISASGDPIEFNKTFLFIILVLLTTIFYFIKSYKEKEFIFRGTFLDWGILGLLFFTVLSFLFSQNYYISAVGLSGFYSGSIIGIFSFVLFFYLLVNIIKTWHDFQKIIFTLVFSGLVIIIFNIFQISMIYLLPWAETQNYSFNAIANSSLTLAIFSSIFIFITLIIFLISEVKWQKYFGLFGLVISMSLLFLLNKDLPIYFLIGLIILLLVIISFKRKTAPNYWTVVPTIVVTLLILFIIFDSGVLFGTKVSENILLDNSTASTIAWEGIKEYPLWGSGQQTFFYDFAKFRPVEFNNLDIWNIQFLKSSNEWLGLLATVGLGVVISLLFIYFKMSYHIWRSIVRQKVLDEKVLWQIAIFFSWVLIFMMSIFIPFNFILYFLNWLLLGLSIVAIDIGGNKFSECRLDLKKINYKYWLMVLGFSGTIILLTVVFIFGGRIWIADYKYASAQRAITANEDIDGIFSKLTKATELNPYESKYFLSLAQGYSAQALLETENYDINSPEIQSYTQKVVDNLKQAKLIDPKNSVVYEREADMYDSLRLIIGNVDELSVDAYLTAIELEPNDPLLWLNLGRSRLLLAQTIFINNDNEESINEANSLLDLAIDDFEKTRDLKSDLAIDYNIGLVYQTKGELDKALEYFYKELAIYPESLNLRYQIALVYQQSGDIQSAIDQLNIILELDPNNQSIIDVIAEMEASLTAEETPVAE